MKLSNETKIGLIATVALILLFLGFSYLKGKNIFHHEKKMYAVYKDVVGLKKSNPVVINGLQVGSISDIDGGIDMRDLLVTVTFSKDVNIPDNSIAVITPNLLGSTSLEIRLGDSDVFKNDGDTLNTSSTVGAIDEALKVLNPVLFEVRNAVNSLDSVLRIVSTTFDDATRNHIQEMIENVNVITHSFVTSARSLESVMNPDSGALGKSFNNINVFTDNLNKHNQNLDTILTNVKVMSNQFGAADFKSTIDSLGIAVNNFSEVAKSINSKNGSVGMLLHDKKLYENLEATTTKLNTLIDDIRVHPRRYVNISVFGKKDKKEYLLEPLRTDSTVQK